MKIIDFSRKYFTLLFYGIFEKFKKKITAPPAKANQDQDDGRIFYLDFLFIDKFPCKIKLKHSILFELRWVLSISRKFYFDLWFYFFFMAKPDVGVFRTFWSELWFCWTFFWWIDEYFWNFYQFWHMTFSRFQGYDYHRSCYSIFCSHLTPSYLYSFSFLEWPPAPCDTSSSPEASPSEDLSSWTTSGPQLHERNEKLAVNASLVRGKKTAEIAWIAWIELKGSRFVFIGSVMSWRRRWLR